MRFHFIFYLAKAIDRSIFASLHDLVRKFHLQIMPWLLHKFCGFRWIPRHSVKNKKNFHLLYSDLDLALVLPFHADPEAVQKTLTKYNQLKKWLLFLGELEVYFEHEWNEKTKLEQAHGEILQLVRNFRKIKWLKADLQRYQDPYHRSKAERALAKIDWNYNSELRKLLKPETFQFLNSLPAPDSEYIAFFDQEVLSSLGHEWSLFLRAVAPNFNSPLPQDSELQNLRKIVCTHEWLSYQAYLRMNQRELFATNDWLEKISNELKRGQVRQAIDCQMKTFRFSQATQISEIDLNLPFRIQLDLTERMIFHLNESYLAVNVEEAWKQEMALHLATEIISPHPFLSQWLRSNLPNLEGKMSENFGNMKLLSETPKAPSQIVSESTLSFWGPLSPRFGLHLLLDLGRQIEFLTKKPLKIELCGPQTEHSEKALFDFLQYASVNDFEVCLVDEPTGILILPYRWNLDEEIQWAEKALETGKPAVIGFSPDFSKHVSECLQQGRIWISPPFLQKPKENSSQSSSRKYTWELFDQKALDLPEPMRDLKEYLESHS